MVYWILPVRQPRPKALHRKRRINRDFTPLSDTDTTDIERADRADRTEPVYCTCQQVLYIICFYIISAQSIMSRFQQVIWLPVITITAATNGFIGIVLA